MISVSYVHAIHYGLQLYLVFDNVVSRLWCKYDMTHNGHTLEYMDFLRRLGVNAKPKNQANKPGESIIFLELNTVVGNYTSPGIIQFSNRFFRCAYKRCTGGV